MVTPKAFKHSTPPHSSRLRPASNQHLPPILEDPHYDIHLVQHEALLRGKYQPLHPASGLYHTLRLQGIQGEAGFHRFTITPTSQGQQHRCDKTMHPIPLQQRKLLGSHQGSHASRPNRNQGNVMYHPIMQPQIPYVQYHGYYQHRDHGGRWKTGSTIWGHPMTHLTAG